MKRPKSKVFGRFGIVNIVKWLELSVQVPSEFVEPVSYLFGRYGRGFSIEDVGGREVLLRTYLTSTSKQRRARIEVGVKLIGILKPIQGLSVREIDGIDWQEAWKEHFTLLRAGRSLVIKPPWTPYAARDGDLVIELDPGLAFGTGHHPTTLMCLEELEVLARPGMRVLDLGAGSGILSIAAVRLGVGTVMALDVDPTAVKVARRALKSNGVKDMVKLACGTLPQKLAPEGTFDLAVANISSKVVQDRAQDLHHCLKTGGKLVASGFLDRQEQGVKDRLEEVGFVFQRRRTIDDWVTLVYSKGE